jgi:hypothetical protein
MEKVSTDLLKIWSKSEREKLVLFECTKKVWFLLVFILDSDQKRLQSALREDALHNHAYAQLASLSLCVLELWQRRATRWARKAGQDARSSLKFNDPKSGGECHSRTSNNQQHYAWRRCGRPFRFFPSPIFHVYWKVNTRYARVSFSTSVSPSSN